MKSTWKIADRATDMEKKEISFSPEAMEERQIKRIIKDWEKNGIPEWARKAMERGEAIRAES